MRVLCLLAISVGLDAVPLRWLDLAPPMRALLTQAGLPEPDYPACQVRHRIETENVYASNYLFSPWNRFD